MSNEATQTTPSSAATISLAGAKPLADVPPRLFGSFVEHLGRCVYGGIYEPDHPTADENGFRQDVLDLVKELGVTCVRYPGGNFVSNYNWEDGTGPRDQRPVRRDLAWHCTETNQMGIDDFYRWSQKSGTEIMLAVNMGTRGLKAALEELEYVNGTAGTELADRRVRNGIEEPMDVKMWCIGNEMDGPWQVGHMSPDEYAAAVDRVAHAMKLAESGLELVACGSSNAHMPTFGEWERKVLTKAYKNLDFVSAHAYYMDHGHRTHDAVELQDFLASSEDMTYFITTVAAQADAAKAANHGDKDIALSFDEWGVWYSDAWNEQEEAWKQESANGLHHGAWPVAPHLLEDIYTAADAVVEGSLMITLLKHCDRVRSASRAQLVNVIAPIMAEPNGGPAWRQTIFYPFAEAAAHARGDVFVPTVASPTVATKSYGEVAAIEAVVTWDAAARRGLLLAVNRDLGAAHDVTVSLDGLAGAGDVTVTRAQMLHSDNPYLQNTAEDPDAVTPGELTVSAVDAGTLRFAMPAVSWAAVEFTA
ncbi:alpha-L-arabinofuranosidase [Bifidobacterium ramosum]|uniref:non-reducing end alpha-L-arabinofuranosidase n=1 Tax=Bifidobacterium ramosum TaxID=1798158 RepID=A0A6L4WYQ5_9BIFI|nr:alpha-L-arabinofuranosidase C-terminal domain-containing protein [Bifidobacterium ramosum]KAB8287222.1 alpha-L-arabinofuranosidase [Bifidobacterium ramosum]NEG71935.1 alpha-L-arabinofuranosidase [Bifidobacterium ramosum]